jgi:phenylacetic acid degradation operon negative regulatory protein
MLCFPVTIVVAAGEVRVSGMTQADPVPPVTGALAPKVPILTIYGLYARKLGNWLAIADLIRLMADLGYPEQVTRSAASRMKKGALLEPQTLEQVPGYRLSAAAMDILADGDARIFHAEIPADPADGWILIAFSVPEQRRAERHVLRSRLVGLGFGQVSGGVWVAPRRTLPELRRMLERTGLVAYASLWEARYLGDAAALVKEAWDLPELERSYEQFLEAGLPVAARWRDQQPDADSAKDAFTDYTQVVSLWRRLPYRDPGLPAELLPGQWAGQRARELFAELAARLAPGALRYVLTVVARRNVTVPAGPGDTSYQAIPPTP